MSEVDPEDAKLVTLARAARARAGAAEGAAVRDVDGRTYAAVTVTLPSLSLSALEAAVAAAVSSGAAELEAAAVVTAAPDGERAGLAAVRDVGGPATRVLVAGPDGGVRRQLRTDVATSRSTWRIWTRETDRETGRTGPALPAWSGVRTPASPPWSTRWSGTRSRSRRASRRRPGTPSGASCTEPTASSSWSTHPACTARGPCWASDSTTSCGRHGPKWTPSVSAFQLTRKRAGDRFIAAELGRISGTPKLAIVTKIDVASPDQVAVRLRRPLSSVRRSASNGRRSCRCRR